MLDYRRMPIQVSIKSSPFHANASSLSTHGVAAAAPVMILSILLINSPFSLSTDASLRHVIRDVQDIAFFSSAPPYRPAVLILSNHGVIFSGTSMTSNRMAKNPHEALRFYRSRIDVLPHSLA